VVLSGPLSDKDAVADLVVANNQTDTPIRGTVTLNASSGWNVAPAQLEYDLKSGEVILQQITILRDANAEQNGGVIARTEFEGRSYWDILEQGEAPLSLEVSRSRNEVRAIVKNGGSLPAIGYLDIVAPDEFEGEHGAGIPVNLVPRRVAVSVAPFEEQRAVFQITSSVPPRWMALRLAVNGHVLYRPVEARRAE
jgi:hypothetical protein